jgi:membrane-bound lytic murein transglycosylase D
LPAVKVAKINRLGLALLPLAFCLPVQAADSLALVQTLEWHGDSASGKIDDGQSAELSQEDVWQRIRSGFKIDPAASLNPLVATHESWYGSRPDYVRRMVERSRRYLFHIVQEVDRRAMPMEVALLPMIESAFNPTALSPSDASGIWQFIPSTGRHYGLKQDTWYDGRRDFTAATHAALDYLGKLYLDFGDWQLALAAYNCGEGCVARAIQKNVDQGLPTDYASLTLPNETRHYVPKLLAVKNLISNPEQYGIEIDTLPNEPYFNQVRVHASMDIHSAAKLAGMSSTDFIALNAAFPRNLIRSDTPVNLLVPVDKADKFQRNLESGTWDSWQPQTVKKGERPEAIARRFDVSIDRLKEHNQFHLKRGKLVRDQTILVPIKGRGVVASPSPAAVAVATDSNTHQVGRGDTLFSVARRYGTTVTQLIQANPNLDSSIRPGQVLLLPASENITSKPAAIRHVAFKPGVREPVKPTRYTVKRGDTLHAIADRFDVTLAELKAWNRAFRKSSSIRPGQAIVVRNH